MSITEAGGQSYEQLWLAGLEEGDSLIMRLSSESGEVSLQYRVDNTDKPDAPLGRVALSHRDIDSQDSESEVYDFRIIGCYTYPTEDDLASGRVGYNSFVYHHEELRVGSHLNGIVSVAGGNENGMTLDARQQRSGIVSELVVIKKLDTK